MKCYVYYHYGYFSEGDHVCGLEVYESMEEARARVDEIVNYCDFRPGDEAVIIQGEHIT